MASLQVERNEFRKALRMVPARGIAILSFGGGRLLVRAEAIEMELPATGEWPGEARMPAVALKKAGRLLPEQDPLVLQVEDGRFSVARLSFPCAWLLPGDAGYGDAPPAPAISAGPSLLGTVALRSRYTEVELAAAGLAQSVTAAEARLAMILDTAATALRPYGITDGDLLKLCQARAAWPSRFCEQDGPIIERIAKAWAALAPFGVETGDLKKLIDDTIRNAWK